MHDIKISGDMEISEIISEEDIEQFKAYLDKVEGKERNRILRHLCCSIWSVIHHKFPDIQEPFLYSIHILRQAFAEYYPPNGLFRL